MQKPLKFWWFHCFISRLPGKSHGWRSLVGCSPWGRWESDTTERLHFHFPLSCIGEGNGNPLQCSCLENPRDGGAWWAAVYGVAQSRTRLKRRSSSSSTLFLVSSWYLAGFGVSSLSAGLMQATLVGVNPTPYLVLEKIHTSGQTDLDSSLDSATSPLQGLGWMIPPL